LGTSTIIQKQALPAPFKVTLGLPSKDSEAMAATTGISGATTQEK
jgi:hypothetical protein